MDKTNGRQWKQYKYRTTLVPFIIMVAGVIVFFTVDCRGQETVDQELLPEEYAKSIKYEDPGILKAYEILPPELIEGEHYKVMRDVATYDLTNRFTILSTFGPFEAFGEDMLRIRIQEIQAIAALQEIKRTKAFRNAAEQAAMSSVRGAKNLITHPVGTVSGSPRGVGSLFGRGGDTEDSVTKEQSGFSRVKRTYAYKLGVDVYSSNKILQKELNSVSWAGFAGGAGVSLLTMPISDAVGNVIKSTTFTDKMNKILLDNAPEDLKRINREKLQQLGVEDSIIEEFLNHPRYSPRHETILVHALADMEGVKNRDQFIKQAVFAVDEEDALYFQRIAEMLYNYHKNEEPISEMIPVRKVVVGYTVEQAIVVTLPIDYVYWTERADKGIEALLKLESPDRPVERMEILISGEMSIRAKEELLLKGIISKENM